MPHVLLLTGTCASGKSTVAQLLVDRYGWARVSEDDVWRAHFHRNRGQVGSAEHRGKRTLVRDEVLVSVREALGEGRNVVLDATVHEGTPDSSSEYASLFAAAGIEWTIRVLHPRLEVAIARDAARPDWQAGAAGVASLWRKFSGERFGGDVFLDTSEDTPGESAARVIASLTRTGKAIMPDCIFCRILAGEAEATVVWRDDLCTAFMDIQPVNPGHLLVVPNAHAAHLADLEEDAAAHLMRVGHRLTAALRASGLKCEGVNLFLADGEAAMQEIFHVHLHVFPRWRGDGFGLRFGPDYRNRPARAALEDAAARIRAVLPDDGRSSGGT